MVVPKGIALGHWHQRVVNYAADRTEAIGQ